MNNHVEIFPWNDSFDTGLPEIDAQHKYLVALLNQLANHLAYKNQSATLEDIFNQLTDYAIYHFETEEAIWQQYFNDDEWRTAHQVKHENFIRNIVKVKSFGNTNNYDEVMENVVTFLTQWLAFHIIEEDKCMATVVLAIQQGGSFQEAKSQANVGFNAAIKALIKSILNMYHNLSQKTLQLIREINERQRVESELRLAEERLRLVLEGSEVGLWDWNIETGEVVRNALWAKMLGYSYEEIAGTTQQWTDYIHPDDRAMAWQSINDCLEGRSLAHNIEYRMLHKDGSIRWILDHANIVQRDQHGKPIRMCGTHTDITERKQTEIQLRIAAIIFESKEGMFVTDANSVILQANRAFTEITGFTLDDVINKTPRLFKSERHDAEFYKVLWQTVVETGGWQGEIWNKRKTGGVYPQWLTITAIKNSDNTQVTNYVATFMDITERKNNEHKIHQLAFYDPLTKLPNRRLLQERLKHYITLEQRHHERTAILMLDLDKFKLVNDSLGHTAGDELLQQVAKRISQRMRESDMVARLGGDEFVLLVHKFNQLSDVENIAQTIIAALSCPFTLSQNNKVEIGVSIGISLHPEHGDTHDLLIDTADLALYEAKNNGRGCFAHYSLKTP